MTHVRTPGKAYDAAGKHTGPGEWLTVIHEVNRIAPGTFGEPQSAGPWWAGGWAEEYADARVLHREDGSVSLVSKTDRGAELAQAAGRLGIHADAAPRGQLAREAIT
jgi:hypothetical protein